MLFFPVDDDVDGIPFKEAPISDNGPAPGFVSSKWERVSPKRVEAQVREQCLDSFVYFFYLYEL